MKNLKIRKLMALILSAAMLLSCMVSSYAVDSVDTIDSAETIDTINTIDPTETIDTVEIIDATETIDMAETFTGTVTSDYDIDLSGIRVNVFSSELIDTEFELEVYGDTYEYSVYTDSNGQFSFDEPSEYFSYSIDLATLPEDYGASEYSVPVDTGDSLISIDLSPISTVDAYINNNNVNVIFEDTEGNIIYADYEVIPDEATYLQVDETNSMQETSVNYSELDSLDTITYSGTIVTSGSSYRYSETCDISECSTIEKIDALYSAGMISEEEKISYYTDYFAENITYDESGIIGLPVEISDYYSADASDGSGEASTYAFSQTPPTLSNTVTVEITSNYSIDIHYADSFEDISMVSSYVDLVVTNLSGFMKCFRYPISEALVKQNMKYDIYITDLPDPDKPALGQAFADYSNGYSYMVLYTYLFTLSNKATYLKQTIAHEFTHSILFRYDLYQPSWFHEGLATAVAYVYSNNVDGTLKNKVDSYISDLDQGISWFIEDRTGKYGTMLLFLYIYENYGGWDALNSVIYNLQFVDTVYEALTVTYSGITYDYRDAFGGMAGCVYNCTKLFASAPQEDSLAWKLPDSDLINEIGVSEAIGNLSVNPMAFEYNKYINNTGAPCNVKCRIETGDTTKTFSIVAIAENDANKITVGKTIYHGYYGFTVKTPNLGYDSFVSIIMVPVNINTSGTAISYTARSFTYTE